MPEPIQAILFDLGDTLLDFGTVDLSRLFDEGGRRAHGYLQSLGLDVPALGRYRRKNLRAIHWNVVKSVVLHREFHAGELMGRVCRKLGLDVSEDQIRQLCWLWYEPLSQQATTEPGLREMLESLRDRGLKLAVVSNTFIPAWVLDRHLEQANLIDLLPTRIYSCDIGVRKPHRRIFQAACQAVGVEPQQAVFVGDSPRADIRGGKHVGMTTVLKDPVGQYRDHRCRPAYRVQKVVDLPEALAELLPS